MTQKDLLSIRQAAFNALGQLKGPETNTEHARAWVNAVREWMQRRGDLHVTSETLARERQYLESPDVELKLLYADTLTAMSQYATQASDHSRQLAMNALELTGTPVSKAH